MDFVTQFENTLQQTIDNEMYSEAQKLLDAYPATGQPYTLKIFSLINRFRQKASSQPLRVVLFQTGNYILDYILKEFLTAFSKQGYATYVFDPSDFAKSTEGLFNFARSGIDKAYFFNNVGLLQTLNDGRNLWEVLDVACYDFIVDHPMYYADSLDYAPAKTTLLCADQTHADYARRFYPRLQNTLFFPTGGCELPENITPWSERQTDVLFIGSYKQNITYKEDSLDLLIKEHLITHTEHTFEQATSLCLSENSTCLNDAQLKKVIEDHRFCETNLTSLYRKKILTELVDAGIDIHVYGNGWEQTGLTANPNFHLHAPVSFEEALSLMGNAKIVLNHMAWFKNGSSERIFNAMAHGAVCVTDSSRYLDEILVSDVNCITYSLTDILPEDTKKRQRLSDTVSALLSSPDRCAEIATQGRKLSELHTWQTHILCAIIDASKKETELL